MEYDVLIVGGGISGLSCAHHIIKSYANIRIKIIEAKDRLGGRVFGKQVKTNNGFEKFDVGGQWIGITQFQVTKLLQEFHLETYEQYFDGNMVTLLQHRQRNLTGDILKMSLTSLPMVFDLVNGLKKIDDLCQMLSIEDPMSCPYAKEWDSISIGSAKQWLFSSHACRKMTDIAVLTVFGVMPSQISFLYFLLYFRCGGGCAALLDESFKGNAQEYKVKGGMFQLTEKLAHSIGYNNILTNSPVTSIQMTDKDCCVTTLDGSILHSKYTVLAIPPHLICDISITPALSYNHQTFLRYLHPGHLIKFIATFQDRFWVNDGLSGSALHWPYYRDATKCPVHMTYDATSCTGSPALVGFIGGILAGDMYNLAEDEIKRQIINSLILLFGPVAGQPIDIIIQDWHKEPYNGGCPITFSSPGAISLYGDSCLRQPLPRLHFAGTETATIWRGFIDGAVQSGIRAANEIVQKLNPQYKPVDVIELSDILVNGSENAFNTPYYILNGVWMTARISCVVLGIYFAVKCFKNRKFLSSSL